MSTLLIKNARYIVSCDDTDRLYERSNLFIRDNAIEYIGPELRQADQVIDASRMVVYQAGGGHHLFVQVFPHIVQRHQPGKELHPLHFGQIAGKELV